MARIRTIKPEFWTSEQIVECSLEARLLFIGLWNFSDDGGVQPLSLKGLKLKIFPAELFNNDDMQRMIDELEANHLAITYKVQNRLYIQVCGWKHQKIDKPNFRYPQPTGRVPANKQEFLNQNSGSSRDQSRPVARSSDESPAEWNGREGKGSIVGDKIPEDVRKKDLDLAEYMFTRIQSVIPKSKAPNYDSWTNDIRLMRERDNLTHDRIKQVFVWANKDSFWQTNIRSPSTLRDKFPLLDVKAGATKPYAVDGVVI